MDLAGIEPASESLSLEASPITAASLHSLGTGGKRQPQGLGSFIIRPQAQRFACVVSRNHDAGYREYGYNRADEQQLRLLLQLYCCQRLNLISGFIVVRTTDGFLSFKTPVETSTSP